MPEYCIGLPHMPHRLHTPFLSPFLAAHAQLHAQLRDGLGTEAGATALELVHQLVELVEVRFP